MSACPRYNDTLMLDIFGELNQDLKTAWERHLNSCPNCRAEREAIAQTLKIAKTALDTPSLGETEAAVMRERVLHELTVGKKSPRERRQPFFFSRAFIPALASACVLLIALGFLATRLLTGPETDGGTNLIASQEQLQAEEIDIINNLDILRDLDTLNKLAKVIDQPQDPSLQDNVQGKNSHGKKPLFS